MIAHERLAEIQRLIDEKALSQKKIAQLMGVCRATVRAIAKDPNRAERRRDVQADRVPNKRKLPRRCPTCGGLVYVPCKLCRARAYAARMQGRNPERQRAAEIP